ncbi:hypothetical protein QZH41_013559 [Actinostola sp. cb2023]|nr:hypothetical protein QZH41_013560 [Actinostola sp. cb2023]KAK3697183.1 hypothetical protein QZH41_013559 [Actinostola sp. cb2023]
MPEHVKHIEWKDMDKKKFYLFGPTLFLGIRALLYPANLIKIRLQVQRKNALYSGSFDAFFKVITTEGFRGLYKGFMVEGGNSMLVTFRTLVQEEGIAAISKGLSARVMSMGPSSLMVVIGYETVKRLSLKEEDEAHVLVEEEGYLECSFK